MYRKLSIIALAAAFGLTLPGAAFAGTAYVPLGSANEILVIDTTTDRVIRTIPDVEHVHGLGGTPDSPYLVAGSFSEALPGETDTGSAPAGMTEDEHAGAPRRTGRQPGG